MEPTIDLLHQNSEKEAFPELDQTLDDLDIPHLFALFDTHLGGRKAISFVRSGYSCDPQEIRSRLCLVRDLSSVTSAAALHQGISLIQAIAAEQEHLSYAGERLHTVLYRWRVLAAYIKAVDYWNGLLEKEISSPGRRYQALKAYFASLHNDPTYETYTKALESLSKAMPLPRYVTVGMNMRDDGFPSEMSVLGTSGSIDLLREDDSGTEDLNAMFSFSDPGKPSCSLGPDLLYTSQRYGSHFDEYLARNLEARWKTELARAEKLLDSAIGKNSTIPFTEALAALTAPLSFYETALRSSEAFRSRGYSLCQPEPEKDSPLQIRQALYPDFILEQAGIRGNDLVLRRGHAVLITGANHSGKTSYLKTIGQCLLLAQLGFFVPAESMSFTPVRHIFTLFSAGEDTSMTSSRMGLEVKKLTAILKTAGPDDLVLLNEPMTSTNPVEAVSICADMSRHFLNTGTTHLLVTHLYDVYYLLRARLPEEQQPLLESLVTESSYNASAGVMTHTYRLYAHEPLGNSYARETAVSYGITLPDMIADPASLEKAEKYCRDHNVNSVYEGEKADGVSDSRGSGKA